VSGPGRADATRLLPVVRKAIAIMSAGVEAGAYEARDVSRLTLLMGAMIQGAAGFVASRRLTPGQGEALVDDAITLLIAGVSTQPLLSSTDPASSPLLRWSAGWHAPMLAV
jgi:hypothetical protein